MSLERSRIWKRIEIVGDIAVIPIPFDFEMSELMAYADEVMRKTRVKSVWGRKRDVSGIYRLPTYVHLAGENRSDTIYREHGCSYYLDLRKVFFSEKLSYEHKRIAEKVRPGEKVANLFSGFGPISILAYKLRKPKVVYSIDINPYAYYFMMVNVELNSAYGVIPMYGDAFVRLNQLEPLDRIISPLPERDREAYQLSISRLKPGGYLHLFAEVEANRNEDPVNKAMASFPGAVESRVVRSVNPGKYHVILDIRKNT